MALRATHKRLSGGSSNEHIIRLWWINPSTGALGDNSRSELVAWIENERGEMYVEDRVGNRARVGVVTPIVGPKYLRTYADRVWTDNLLSLPDK